MDHDVAAPSGDDPARGRRGAGRTGAWNVHAVRPSPAVALFEIRLGDYTEFFYVVTGDKTVAVTMFDPSDETYREPQVFVFAKPYGWSLDGPDDEVLLRVWQSVGVQR